MGSDFNGADQSDGNETALRGLAYELKEPLINIARQAELGDSESYLNIRQTAEQTLVLIDSYLLNARTEYGQVMLELAPASIGSVFYDVSAQLSSRAKQGNISLLLEDSTNQPVMTHRPALTSILSVFGSSLMGLAGAGSQKIVFRGYKTRAGKVGVGMFTKAKISRLDIKKALDLQGKAHMPFAGVNGHSHVSLAVAEGLCRAIGGEMTVKHMGALSGLATELPRSEQLAFI